MLNEKELLMVNIGKLRENIWKRMAQIASWDKMEKQMYREHKARAIHNIANVLEKYKLLSNPSEFAIAVMDRLECSNR